jgi:hypothetical protein
LSKPIETANQTWQLWQFAAKFDGCATHVPDPHRNRQKQPKSDTLVWLKLTIKAIVPDEGDETVGYKMTMIAETKTGRRALWH